MKKDHDLISRKLFVKQLSLGLGAMGTGLLFPEELSAQYFITGKTNNPKKIIIVGAGLSGLSAAWELIKAGHEVRILEARNRPGGRVSTIREPFAEGLYAEEGAAAYSNTYTNALRFIDEFGLEKIPLALPDQAVIYHLNGKKLVVKPGETVEWPYDLKPEEQKLGPNGIVQKYILETLPPEIKEPQQWEKAPVVHLDKLSLEKYLRQQGASEGAIKLINNTQWFAAVPGDTSGLSMAVSDAGLFMGAAPFILKGGNDRLPREMAERMKDKINYGVEVKQINDNASGVTIGANKNGTASEFRADRVIVTLPLKVLEKVSFQPALSPQKMAAVKDIPVINLTRTYLQVEKPFWLENDLSGMAFSDLPVGTVTPLINQQAPGENPAILESIVAGPASTKMDEASSENNIEKIKKEMEKIYPGTAEYFQKGHVKGWSKDPYALGGPSWPAPGDVTRHLRNLQMPQGNLHFAGEHTSVLRSTMEGALRSGARAAKEVHEA